MTNIHTHKKFSSPLFLAVLSATLLLGGKLIYAGVLYSGKASFYDPRKGASAAAAHLAGGMKMADGSQFVNGDRHCAVPTGRYGRLAHHTLLVCDSSNPTKCLKCYVTDNGPGVSGVDLTPADWDFFGHDRTRGKFPVVISDLGRGKNMDATPAAKAAAKPAKGAAPKKANKGGRKGKVASVTSQDDESRTLAYEAPDDSSVLPGM